MDGWMDRRKGKTICLPTLPGGDIILHNPNQGSQSLGRLSRRLSEVPITIGNVLLQITVVCIKYIREQACGM